MMCDSSNCCEYMFPYFPGNNLPVSSTGVFPSITDFAGQLNFQIILNSNECVKKKWLFSEKLKKVFIDIDKIIGLRFKWDYGKSPEPKFIRALPVYTQDDWLRIPVERCPMHSNNYRDASNLDPLSISHVLRCENEGTVYETDLESRRRSCVTPLILKDDKEVATLFYKFVCKTSCDRGMQRRPIVVIFTLENSLGIVLGRRCLSFKICSCLKRDLDREEQGKQKSKIRKTNYLVPNTGVRPFNVRSSTLPKIITMRSTEITKPSFLELRRLNFDQILFAMSVMHNTLLGELIRNNTEGADILISQVERCMSELPSTYTSL